MRDRRQTLIKANGIVSTRMKTIYQKLDNLTNEQWEELTSSEALLLESMKSQLKSMINARVGTF